MPTISPLSGMAEPPVSVMFAVTSSWLIPLAVAIRSLCVHSDPRRNYELHIVHHGLEEEQMKELGKAVSSYPRVSLGFCRLPERLLRILQHRDCGRFSPLTYGRLLAAALFPRHDRVVYLDVDVLLNGDVAELYDADLHGAPIGAVRDCAVLQSISTGRLPDHLEYISGMGVTNPRLYCNTGVMVMDLVQMREQETEDRLLRLLEAHPDSFPYVDQDIINIVFHGRIAPLPLRWNYHFQFELHHAGMADSSPAPSLKKLRPCLKAVPGSFSTWWVITSRGCRRIWKKSTTACISPSGGPLPGKLRLSAGSCAPCTGNSRAPSVPGCATTNGASPSLRAGISGNAGRKSKPFNANWPCLTAHGPDSIPSFNIMPSSLSAAPPTAFHAAAAPPAIDVMFAVTSAWTVCLAVTLHSLARHSNPERNYRLWVVHDGLEEENMQELDKAVSGYPNAALQFMTIPGKLEQMLRRRDVKRFSALAYARLLAPSLFPRHSRIVYLDADTVLYADVAELYDTDLCGAAVGAVRDTAVLSSLVAGYPRRQLRKLQPLGLHDPFHYFNSGVLVLDLDRMREEDAEVRLLHVIEEHNELLEHPDQDALNIVFHRQIFPLPVEWNYHFQFELGKNGLEESCAGTEFAGVSNIHATCSWKLFHMIGSKKPWLFPEKSEEYIVSAAVWWKPAMETASLRPHLSQLLEEFTQWTRRQLRHNQWHLPFSFGNGFRKRKARINLLKRLLRVFEGV